MILGLSLSLSLGSSLSLRITSIFRLVRNKLCVFLAIYNLCCVIDTPLSSVVDIFNERLHKFLLNYFPHRKSIYSLHSCNKSVGSTGICNLTYFNNQMIISFFLLVFVTEADYTLDDSFWNEESPVGE